jgi:hypothetical protein
MASRETSASSRTRTARSLATVPLASSSVRSSSAIVSLSNTRTRGQGKRRGEKRKRAEIGQKRELDLLSRFGQASVRQPSFIADLERFVSPGIVGKEPAKPEEGASSANGAEIQEEIAIKKVLQDKRFKVRRSLLLLQLQLRRLRRRGCGLSGRREKEGGSDQGEVGIWLVDLFLPSLFEKFTGYKGKVGSLARAFKMAGRRETALSLAYSDR